jgi:hypothetical protein
VSGYSLSTNPLKGNYIQKFYLSCEFNLNDFDPKSKECISEFEISHTKNTNSSQLAINAMSPNGKINQKNKVLQNYAFSTTSKMSHSSFLFTNKQYDKNNEMTNN